MLLVFLLLLPLVIVPFLVEWDNKWFKRFAWCIAGIQMIVMFFRYLPNEQAGLFQAGSYLPESAQYIIKTLVHIF